MNPLVRFAPISTVLLLAACGGTNEAAPKAPPTPAPAAAPAGQAPSGNIPKAPEPTPAVTPTAPAAQPPTTPPSPAIAAPTAAPTTADLNKVLESITDGPTAQAAKGKLDAIMVQLKSAKDAVTTGALGGDIGKLAGAAAGAAGVDLASIKALAKKQVDSLLANEAVKSAIGPTLEQLKALLQ